MVFTSKRLIHFICITWIVLTIGCSFIWADSSGVIDEATVNTEVIDAESITVETLKNEKKLEEKKQLRKKIKAKYRHKKIANVCFEESEDLYKVKRKNNLSTILFRLNLTPLWCANCSVPIGAKMNNIKDEDLIFPNQIIKLPKKCQPSDTLANREPQSMDPFGISVEAYEGGVQTKVISYARFGVEPFLNYSEIKGTTNDSELKLLSTAGVGIKLYYQTFLKAKLEWNAFISMFRTSPESNPAIGEVVDATLLPLTLGAAVLWNHTPEISFSLGGQLKEELYFESISISQAKVNKAWTLEPTGGASYKFYEEDGLNLRLAADAKILFPTSTSFGTTTFGSALEGGVRSTYKLNWGRITAGAMLGNRSQAAENTTLLENYVNYSLGFYYLF